MEKKIALSIDEMQKLEELGLDTSDASMYWTLKADYSTKNSYQLTFEFSIDSIPAYTLQDILERLPKHITKDDMRGYLILDRSGSNGFEYTCEYWSYLYDIGIHNTDSDSALEASYNMLLWCIENNYIKTNK